MEKILSEEQVGAREISRKHTIILQIESPSVPSLDLVDLPGVTLILRRNALFSFGV